MRRFLALFLILCSLSIYSQDKKVKKPTPKWKIHGRFAFLFNQSSFSNWASGGENTVAGNLNVNYDFNYKKNLKSIKKRKKSVQRTMNSTK